MGYSSDAGIARSAQLALFSRSGECMMQRSHDCAGCTVLFLAVHQPRINLLEERPIACAPAAGFALLAANMALNE